jgi:allantoicase
LADWLSGNGCVALPALINNTPIRVMDDLATAERSRWEVWHELYHGRFDLYEFLKIAHEEMLFIRKDLSNDQKIVQVKWCDSNAKWYQVAFNLMIKLMTDKNPVEFASYLLLPFTIPSIRESNDPWAKACEIDSQKFQLDLSVLRFNYFFERCGSLSFSKVSSKEIFLDIESVKQKIMSFNFQDILDAASFHGDIGVKKNLDFMAKEEQALVSDNNELLDLCTKYQQKFKMKFLISAKNKNAAELLSKLKERINLSQREEEQNAKLALFEITKKRIEAEALPQFLIGIDEVKELASKHNIKTSQLSYSSGASIGSLSIGEKTSENTLFQIASLSKTVGTAFALELFAKHQIGLEDSVNQVLKRLGSSFKLINEAGIIQDQVSLKSLMNHTALNMHYVYGIDRADPMPEMTELLNGNAKYNYQKVVVIGEGDGKKFSYSGGGFLVLEHITSLLLKDQKEKAYQEFCQRLGLSHLSFSAEFRSGAHYAEENAGSSKKFPLFAAGMLSNAKDILIFLKHLEAAYHHLNYQPLSHDIAVSMLHGRDLGAQEFMGANIGLGVFIAHAGLNKIMIHQGANDGYRALYLYCYSGPDRGKGISVLATGEQNAVHFISEIALKFLAATHFSGIDFNKLDKTFDHLNVPQEQLVNIGYKNLVFKAFEPLLPERIEIRGLLDPLYKKNLCVHAKILKVTDQIFARAENLFSPHEPIFDPELFGHQGKVMDSWESARHSEAGEESLTFEIKEPKVIKYISFCTKYHLGNQVEDVSLFALNKSGEWVSLASHVKLLGHAYKVVECQNSVAYKVFKVTTYPDGGLSRLGLFEMKESFPIEGVYKEEVPKSKKPLSLAFKKDSKNASYSIDGKFDLASLANGASIESVSNEHYSPASSVLSPYAPLHMFDGFESARSRKPDHFEEAVIKLAHESTISSIVFDFKYFVNNNPKHLKVFGFREGQFHELGPKFSVKAFAANLKELKVADGKLYSKLKIQVYPDGGINRIHIYA